MVSDKKKLDKVFSEYIRRKYANSVGEVQCITCGILRHWKDSMDAGHYIPRNHMATRYSEKNVHPQCRGCNRFGGGRYDVYALKLQEIYGKDILQELNSLKISIVKNFPYEEKIEYYKKELAKLKEDVVK